MFGFRLLFLFPVAFAEPCLFGFQSAPAFRAIRYLPRGVIWRLCVASLDQSAL